MDRRWKTYLMTLWGAERKVERSETLLVWGGRDVKRASGEQCVCDARSFEWQIN